MILSVLKPQNNLSAEGEVRWTMVGVLRAYATNPPPWGGGTRGGMSAQPGRASNRLTCGNAGPWVHPPITASDRFVGGCWYCRSIVPGLKNSRREERHFPGVWIGMSHDGDDGWPEHHPWFVGQRAPSQFSIPNPPLNLPPRIELVAT